ncbi:CRISPR-associated protein Cas2 [Desulfatibacillum alkenivorans DSM 16219]|jgi:CRISPR-associated protein Cas2|uniref:CRISPR-associated endoribonuclease Cas2 n=1 Tax=Desulfatibacillum alkenivorans DSM 16219 TaxID=1121393 RepID=A0A1M6QTW4_9BACT|nr:CRISPR-associated endonuclease Cas2 [Desulfatibacillum alkenivorans]SHK23646.1 CRISPR-associated protein Cas2 [Desulfatibacillum alkenivorans DSM 16219]
MITLITYDITEPKRLQRLNKFLKEFGENTQYSVFECDLDADGLARIRQYCSQKLDLINDSVRIYKICSRCMQKVEISGQGLKITQLDYTVV